MSFSKLTHMAMCIAKDTHLRVAFLSSPSTNSSSRTRASQQHNLVSKASLSQVVEALSRTREKPKTPIHHGTHRVKFQSPLFIAIGTISRDTTSIASSTPKHSYPIKGN